MFSTNLIEEIKQKLIASGIKNTDFPTTDTVNKSDTIHLVQDGKDVQAPVSVLVDKVLQWNINGFLNVSQNGETYTLEEVINSVSADNRKPGQMVTFIDSSTNDWVIYQFKGKDVTDWNNTDLWDPVYDGIRFKGWFMEECLLTEKYPNPIVGDYAYVGTTMEDALLYTCITTGEWYNTGKKVNEGSGSATLHYDILFADLKAKADAGTLVPGCVYTVTDYYCSQYTTYGTAFIKDYPGSAPSDWYISVIAVSTNQLSENAVVTRNPLGSYIGNKILECKYSINKNLWAWTKQVEDQHYRGTIYYLKDEFLNECDYDFKHLKIARFKVERVVANTTPSTSSSLGPFRCYGETGGTRSDTRMWVGSGHDFEKTLIPAIFDGTFPSITGTYTASTGLFTPHEEYTEKLHKPYNWFPWLSWAETTEDLYADMTNGTQYPPLALIDVDSSSAKIVYTFSLVNQNGTVTEASSLLLDYNDTLTAPYFYENRIESSRVLINEDGIQLPNIVCLLTNDSSMYRAYTQNFIRGLNSTIFIYPYGTREITLGMLRTSFGHNKRLGIVKSLLCSPAVLNSSMESFNRMYAAVQFGNVDGLMSTGVMFGYFYQCHFKLSNYNLLFGTFLYVKKEGATSWTSAGDGRCWYNVLSDYFFSSNILNGFQYSRFWPHVNGNTVVDCYNKSVEFKGNIQVNYARGFNWGVTLEYGCANLNIFDHIGRSILGERCFAYGPDANGLWYKVNDAYSYPSFNSLDIKCCKISSANFQTMYDNSSATDWKKAFDCGDYNRYLVVTGDSGIGSCRLINYADL